MQSSPSKGENKLQSPSPKKDVSKEKSATAKKQDKEKSEKEKKKKEDKERNGKSAEEPQKKKTGLGALKAKLNEAKDAVKDNAVNLAGKVRDGFEDSDDSEDSSAEDEDDDDDWLMDDRSEGATTTTASTKTAPSATAITFRNRPAPQFLNMEEEKQIRAQVKSAKQMRKKLKKFKKKTVKTVKYCQQSASIYDSFISFANEVAGDNLCTDRAIAKSFREAVANYRRFREGSAFRAFNEHISSIGEQLDTVRAHAKLLATIEKERRDARDKRIKMDEGDLDVTDEAQYAKAVDIKTDYTEKDARYKEEYKSFLEHNSSQLGQALRNTLLSNAKFLEDMAGALRQAANVEGNNSWFFSDAAVNKYADFKVDPELIKTPVKLFDDTDCKARANTTATTTATEDAYDRLTVKPPSQQPKKEVVQGIPVNEAEQNDTNVYGTSSYDRRVKLPKVHGNSARSSSTPKSKKAEETERIKKEYFGCYLPS